MQSSGLTKPAMAETETLERRRPGRFDDVSRALIPVLRGNGPAADLPPGYAEVTISARDPVAERQTVFKILLIIVALVGLVLLFGR